MALSGGILGLFLLLHLAGNCAILFGREVFNSYAAHLAGHSFFVPVAEAGLFLVFVLHTVLAVLLHLENRKARPVRYSSYRGRISHWGAQTMPYSGLLILIFVTLHLWHFQVGEFFYPHADRVISVLQRPGMALFYVLCLSALGLHLSHGFWSMLQTLGLSHPGYDRLLRGSALLLALLIPGVFSLIPVLSLFSADSLR